MQNTKHWCKLWQVWTCYNTKRAKNKLPVPPESNKNKYII